MPGGRDREWLEASAEAMGTALTHRGPDASGVWSDARAGVALAHRRLSIQDLSSAGAQPMQSVCGRYVISYNGEVFNAPELRADMQASGIAFRGTSDTEAMLACMTRLGVEQAIPRFIGQFAFALWDRETRSLTLVRDRLGLKPLYWTAKGGTVLFGSELKALMACPGFDRTIDRASLAAYLRYSNVPGSQAIFEGVEKVAPGAFVRIHADGRIEREHYWELAGIARDGLARPCDISAEAAREEAETLIADAVKKRLLSDVALGALLSGGIDSSLVAALMQKQSDRPVKTFSIGYAEADYDEARQAAAIAKHLGTDHTELTVTPDDALAVVPKLPEMYDEPFADSSQVPTHLVAMLARRDVTVALTGDGGDEIAAGYNRHSYVGGYWPRISGMPSSLRTAAAGALRAVPSGAWGKIATALPENRRPRLPADKAAKFADLLSAASPGDAWRTLVTHWDDPGALLVDHAGEADDGIAGAATISDVMGRIQYLDMARYLPDDVLCKVDRASMAVALEIRCPLLDHRVVEYFWTLPRDLLAGGGKGKLLLRRILARHVPSHLFERPKMGFGVPIEHWLRGPLRDWAEDLISTERLKRDGLFRPEPIRTAWEQHVEGRADHQYRLWTILMFQAWRARWLEDASVQCAPPPARAARTPSL